MRDFDKIGDYEVVGRIGQGSFGVVYLGRDPYLKREVAIKICSVNDRELRQRFYREAEIAGKLQHENIVTVFSFGLEGELPYLVQEYLAGEDLDAIIKRGDDVAPAQKLDWLRQIARGLAYAHKHGIIHRDIKPGNVRILPEGQVKIMDFGIAKLASAETQLTQKGVTMGSASYLPPEQVQAEELDQRADIFSFGVLAYELLSGQRPFRGNTLSAVVYQILYKVPAPLTASWPACPQPLADLVARCLEKRPQKRYPNFGSLMPELEAVRESLP
ncbi:MAG: serine/threonine protein kinase, partial [Acidobacteria bacterium]